MSTENGRVRVAWKGNNKTYRGTVSTQKTDGSVWRGKGITRVIGAECQQKTDRAVWRGKGI